MMKILDLENKLETLEGDLLITYETVNALQILLSERSITVEQADTILWGITNSISNSVENAKRSVEETIKIRKILESL